MHLAPAPTNTRIAYFRSTNTPSKATRYKTTSIYYVVDARPQNNYTTLRQWTTTRSSLGWTRVPQSPGTIIVILLHPVIREFMCQQFLQLINYTGCISFHEPNDTLIRPEVSTIICSPSGRHGTE